MAFQKMRVATREVTDPAEINKILQANHIVRIAWMDEDEGYPYIVPLNYGYEYDLDSGKLTLYQHCAKDGRKLNLLRKNNRVGFEIDETWGLRQTESACAWGLNFNSVIGSGKIFIVPDEDEAAKRHALDVMMKKHGRYHDLSYAPASFARTAVLRLEAEEFRVKRYRDRTVPDEELMRRK